MISQRDLKKYMKYKRASSAINKRKSALGVLIKGALLDGANIEKGLITVRLVEKKDSVNWKQEFQKTVEALGGDAVKLMTEAERRAARRKKKPSLDVRELV